MSHFIETLQILLYFRILNHVLHNCFTLDTLGQKLLT